MSEQPFMVNKQPESSLHPACSARPRHISVARHISNILSPAVISLPLVLLVALYRATGQTANWLYALLTLFFLSFGPLLYIIIGVRLGKFTDVDVSVRSQRVGPFLFGIASCFAGLFVIIQTHGPKNLQTLLLMSIISGIILMVTTFWWKISIHASTLAGAVTILTVLYGLIVLPAYLLVVLVSWSRVVLRRHTVAQVIAGSLVSIVMALLLLMLRGI